VEALHDVDPHVRFVTGKVLVLLVDQDETEDAEGAGLANQSEFVALDGVEQTLEAALAAEEAHVRTVLMCLLGVVSGFVFGRARLAVADGRNALFVLTQALECDYGDECKENALWVATNLVRGDPALQRTACAAGLPRLAAELCEDVAAPPQLLSLAACALAQLAAGPESWADVLEENGLEARPPPPAPREQSAPPCRRQRAPAAPRLAEPPARAAVGAGDRGAAPRGAAGAARGGDGSGAAGGGRRGGCRAVQRGGGCRSAAGRVPCARRGEGRRGGRGRGDRAGYGGDARTPHRAGAAPRGGGGGGWRAGVS